MVGVRGVGGGTHVLSLATIMHSTPETLPIPVMIPPAGISSPGYSLYPAKGDNSRKADPGSRREVIRLPSHSP